MRGSGDHIKRENVEPDLTAPLTMDPQELDLEPKDEIMQYIDFSDTQFSSELEFSEDGASSVTSSVEMPFEPLDYGAFAFDEPISHESLNRSMSNTAMNAMNPPPAAMNAMNPMNPMNPAMHAMNSHAADPAVKQEPAWMHAVRDVTQAYAPAQQSNSVPTLIENIKFGAARESQRPEPVYMDRKLLREDRTKLKYQLVLDKFPDKSRVETQIKCNLTICTSDGRPPSESLLKLPADTIMRPRFQLKDADQLKQPEFLHSTLYLEIDAINPHVPDEPIAMCAKCLAREKKRAFRKKTLDPNEEQCWTESVSRRIVIINGKEVVPIRASGAVELPLRIGCYCRHHAAKSGYQLIFALRNADNQLLGFTSSSSIFITDSHKDQRRPGLDAIRPESTPYSRTRTSSVSSVSSSSVSDSPSIPNWIASVPQLQPPQVLRAIPPAGPTRGGIEVTLLGTHFVPGLVAMFGDVPAVQTQFWSDTTIIAHLPPSAQAGSVAISFQSDTNSESANRAQFTYVGDGDAKLQELALQMAGRSPTPSTVDQPTASAEPLALYVLDHASEYGANPNLRNPEGQTMAHLAAMLGYSSVLVKLAACNAHLDMQDVSGMTPLHFACLFGKRNTARVLLQHSADPFRRTLNGHTTRDLADVELMDLLPTNARTWYLDQNRKFQPVNQEPVSNKPIPPVLAKLTTALRTQESLDSIASLNSLGSSPVLSPVLSPVSLPLSPPLSPTSTALSVVPSRAHSPQPMPPPYSRLFPEKNSREKMHTKFIGPRQSLEWQLAQDRMLFTFWVPLLCVTVLALLTIYVMRSCDGTVRDAIVSRVRQWGSGVIQRILPAVTTHGAHAAHA